MKTFLILFLLTSLGCIQCKKANLTGGVLIVN